MIELTEQQCQELNGSDSLAVNPRTNEKYVLVRKELYDRLRGIPDEDDARLMAPLLAEIDAEDWEDVSVYEGTP